MLDADSVFERLLHEAANLVSKMSTPKLTNALKFTSHLQQKISETISSRCQQENDGIPVETSTASFRLDPHSGLSRSSTNSQAPGISVCDANFKPADFSPNEKDGATVPRDVKLNHIDLSHAKLVDLEYSDDIVLLDSNSGPDSDKPDGTAEVHEQPFLTFSSDSTLSAAPLMPMASTAPDSGHFGTILLPIMSSVRTSTTASYPHSTASSSEHLTVVADGQAAATSEPNCAEHEHTGAVNFVDVLFSDKSDSNHQITQNGCNRVTTTTTSSSPMLIAQSSVTAADVVGMKPEPADSSSTASVNPSLLSSLSTLPSFATNPLCSTSPSALRLSTVPMTVTQAMAVTSDNPSNPGAYDTDMNVKSTHGAGPYRCRDCDKEFRILRYLEKHRRIHTGEKPYQCCYCGRQFNDWPNMNRHKRIHTGERPYRCSVCAKTFSQPAVYNEHVKRHTGERPYICMVCAKGFPRAARLAVHMRVHTGERPYPCTSCDRRFSQPHHLAAHLRIHSGDRPYTCTKCDVSFACISNLRRHRKQVHASSPSATEDNEAADTSNEKKPLLQRLAAAVLPQNEIPFSTTGMHIEPSGLSSMSTAFGSDSSPVALAAAMSGTLLTATGALVPAGLLSASSLPGLILTSGPSGALLAASNPFADQSQHLQPTLLAHASGLTDNNGSTILSNSGGQTAIPVSLAPHPSVSTTSTPDSQMKSIPSSTVSLMLPPMLTASGNPDNLRQTTVTFLTPTGELDRSCLTGTTLATGTQDGGFIVNSASGEAVYLEPLDPRFTFESGHQFTLATIPTSLSQGTAAILGPSNSGTTHLFGHPIQLQTGSQTTTHIAFATNLSGQSHLLAPTSSVFSTQPASVYAAGQGSPAILFTSAVSNNQHTITTSVSSGDLSRQLAGHVTSSTVVSAHLPNSSSSQDAGNNQSNTQTSQQQQQATLLVPVVNNSTVDHLGSTGMECVSTPCWPPPGFQSSSTAGTHHHQTHHPSPDHTSGTFDEHTDSSVVFINSRPSSVMSSSSMGTVQTTAVSENI